MNVIQSCISVTQAVQAAGADAIVDRSKSDYLVEAVGFTEGGKVNGGQYDIMYLIMKEWDVP